MSPVTRDQPIGRVVKCRRPDLPVYACDTI
jgi:hypothetical protein